MRIINKALCASMLAASLAGFISAPATAQNAGIQFRVVAGDRNPSGCQQFDAPLSRVHTFTAAGDSATLATAGGTTTNMKQTTPGVFTSTLGIGGTNFNIVADTSKSPKALEVTEPRLGCRWNAVAP